VRVLTRAVAVGITMLASLGTGCGYALAGRGTSLPSDIRVVAIPTLQNQTAFFNVEQVLTDKIRTEFIGRGKYQVVPEASGAQAVLNGAITSIGVAPVGFTAQQLASRYQFTITMKVDFVDTRSNKVLWSNDALTFREEYELTTSGNSTTAVQGATFLDQQRSSFERIATDAARTVVTAILEAF
jgi:hypothetical protein